MTLFWIAIGTLALAAPHIATVGTDGAMAWGGLPFPAECAFVLLAVLCFYLTGVPKRMRGALEPATLIVTLSMLVLEVVGALFGEGSQGGLVWGFVDETLHATAVTLWILLVAVSRREAVGQDDRMPNVLVATLLFISGAVWYLTTAAVRYALTVWEPAHEMLLWACALLWAAPIATLLRTASCTKRDFAVRAGAPVLGVLVANRTWVILLNLGVPAPSLGDLIGVLLAGAILSLAALVIAWINEKPAGTSGEQPLPSREGTTGDAPNLSAQLPFHLIPGYDTLSEREQAVLLQTLAGATATTIAANYGISDATVRTYRARAYEKLQVSGSAELLSTMRAAIEKPALTQVTTHQHVANDCTPEAALMAACIGAAVALALAALIFGPRAYLARRAILTAATIATALWLVFRERALWDGSPWLALTSFLIVGAALVPSGVRVQALVHSTLPFFFVAACLVVAAFALKDLVSDAEALVAAATLAGDERVLAYLQGRGISDVMAQVALLTARDFPQGGIAATLHVSNSTVAKYRTRVYKALGVKGKEELTQLLEREAGLSSRGGVSDVQSS